MILQFFWLIYLCFIQIIVSRCYHFYFFDNRAVWVSLCFHRAIMLVDGLNLSMDLRGLKIGYH